MRTEEDLRAALLALEREAPAAAQVLPKTTADRVLPKTTTRRPRFAGLAAFGVAVAIGVAVAVAVALLPGAGSAPRHHTVSQAVLPHDVLRAKLLDALAGADSKIIYDRTTISSPGAAAAQVMESWYYPWRPKAGELVRGRELVLNRDGTPLRDTQLSYAEPTPKQQLAASGEIIDVEYGTRTWSDRHVSQLMDASAGSPLNIWYLVHDGNWSVVGKTELDGRPAIKLRFTLVSNSTRYLWIDAQTYLPLRDTFSGVVGMFSTPQGVVTTRDSTRNDYQYLAPTAENLAKLTAPIPPGFTRTAAVVEPRPSSAR